LNSKLKQIKPICFFELKTKTNKICFSLHPIKASLVVDALGDYLVAGSDYLSNTTIDSFKDFPQVSFAMGKEIFYWIYQEYAVILTGGKGDWRIFTTLPNILKQFNPDLIGYSVGISIGPSGVRALPLAAGINVGGHYKGHFFLSLLSLLSPGSLLILPKKKFGDPPYPPHYAIFGRKRGVF
jgi:hypothetical protein